MVARAAMTSVGAFVATVLAVASALAAGASVPADRLSPERKASLVHLLRHDCGSCHGMRLLGGLGPPLTAQALEAKPGEMLVATVLYGRPGTPMPPWRGALSETEVRWLIDLLKSGELQ